MLSKKYILWKSSSYWDHSVLLAHYILSPTMAYVKLTILDFLPNSPLPDFGQLEYYIYANNFTLLLILIITHSIIDMLLYVVL